MKGYISPRSKSCYQRAPAPYKTYQLKDFEPIFVEATRTNQEYFEYVRNMCQNLSRDRPLFYSARPENKIKVLYFYSIRFQMQVQSQNQIRLKAEILKRQIEQKKQIISKIKTENYKAKMNICKFNHQSFVLIGNIRKMKSIIKSQSQSTANSNLSLDTQRYPILQRQKGIFYPSYPSFCQREIKNTSNANTLYKKRFSLNSQFPYHQTNSTESNSRISQDQQRMMSHRKFPSNTNSFYGFPFYNPYSQVPIDVRSCMCFGQSNRGCCCNLQQYYSNRFCKNGCINNLSQKEKKHAVKSPKINLFRRENPQGPWSQSEKQNSPRLKQKSNRKMDIQKQLNLHKICEHQNQSQAQSQIPDICQQTDDPQNYYDFSTPKRIKDSAKNCSQISSNEDLPQLSENSMQKVASEKSQQKTERKDILNLNHKLNQVLKMSKKLLRKTNTMTSQDTREYINQ